MSQSNAYYRTNQNNANQVDVWLNLPSLEHYQQFMQYYQQQAEGLVISGDFQLLGLSKITLDKTKLIDGIKYIAEQEKQNSCVLN